VISTLLAPREQAHTIRADPYRRRRPAQGPGDRSSGSSAAILLVGALLVGSGLSGDASLLSKFAGGEALEAAWKAKPNGVWLQVAGVLIGGLVVVIVRRRLADPQGPVTKPGVYLSTALGDRR
jgi:PAT family beta-lactamase induction signal transducer AmpG